MDKILRETNTAAVDCNVTSTSDPVPSPQLSMNCLETSPNESPLLPITSSQTSLNVNNLRSPSCSKSAKDFNETNESPIARGKAICISKKPESRERKLIRSRKIIQVFTENNTQRSQMKAINKLKSKSSHGIVSRRDLLHWK